jgi:hypothetical protein
MELVKKQLQVTEEGAKAAATKTTTKKTKTAK